MKAQGTIKNARGVRSSRSILARVCVLLAVFIFLQASTVLAAPKLKKADFTKMSGRYKVNFMYESYDEDSDFHYANMIDETGSPARVLKTYRGITFGDSQKKVISKYGKAAFKKVNCRNDNLYYGLFDIDHDRSSYLLRKLSKYVDYRYYKGWDEYRIRFYFDKQGYVRTIAYFKNYNDL